MIYQPTYLEYVRVKFCLVYLSMANIPCIIMHCTKKESSCIKKISKTNTKAKTLPVSKIVE